MNLDYIYEHLVSMENKNSTIFINSDTENIYDTVAVENSHETFIEPKINDTPHTVYLDENKGVKFVLFEI